MQPNASKHTNDEEKSLSTDVFNFLQQDHNLLTIYRKKRFYCEVCTKSFSKENDLHYHRLDHVTDKPLYICEDSIEEPISENHISSENKEECRNYDRIFTCQRCHKRFPNVSCLRSHQKLFHLEYVPTSSCDHCSSHFKWKHHLAVHKYADSSENTSSCNTCPGINTEKESCASNKYDDETSVAKNDLNVHDLSRIHQKVDTPFRKKYVCQICLRRFSFPGNLSRHILVIHARRKLLTSKYHEKKQSGDTDINSHCKIHIKRTPFTCSICEKKFTHQGFLNRHIRLHNEGKLFCKVCYKVFLNNSTLEEHLIVHRNEKLFVCQLCFKNYKRQKDLERHLQIHSHKKPYPCDFCEKRFLRRGCLNTHIMRFHSSQRPA